MLHPKHSKLSRAIEPPGLLKSSLGRQSTFRSGTFSLLDERSTLATLNWADRMRTKRIATIN